MTASQPIPFGVRVERHDGRLHLVPRGELDLETAPELEERALAALRDGGEVVLDLRELDFMDSTGVRTLVLAHQTAQGDGAGSLTIVAPSGEGAVGRIIAVAGLAATLGLVEAP
jgi:anti-anti-sigma factor